MAKDASDSGDREESSRLFNEALKIHANVLKEGVLRLQEVENEIEANRQDQQDSMRLKEDPHRLASSNVAEGDSDEDEEQVGMSEEKSNEEQSRAFRRLTILEMVHRGLYLVASVHYALKNRNCGLEIAPQCFHNDNSNAALSSSLAIGSAFDSNLVGLDSERRKRVLESPTNQEKRYQAEIEYYGEAETVRRKILAEDEQLIANLIPKVRRSLIETAEAIDDGNGMFMPEIAIKGTIFLNYTVERIQKLLTKLDDQWEIINDWREK